MRLREQIERKTSLSDLTYPPLASRHLKSAEIEVEIANLSLRYRKGAKSREVRLTDQGQIFLGIICDLISRDQQQSNENRGELTKQ
jgi:hypothetical protein